MPGKETMTPENPYFSSDPSSSTHVEEAYGEDIPPSIAIIRAIATIEETDPVDSATELGIRLYDQINPKALDNLFTNGGERGDVLVDLSLYNEDRYDVLVRDSGQVIVWKRD